MPATHNLKVRTARECRRGGVVCGVCAPTIERLNRSNRRQSKGHPGSYVAAAPVREHVQRLLDSGMSASQIVKGAGLTYDGAQMLVYNLIAGQPHKRQPPAKRIMAKTARALMGVQPNPALVVNGALTDATGTRRRIQALVADGWTLTYLGERLGTNATNLTTTMKKGRILATTARKVSALYDELAHTKGPARHAGCLKRRQGWLQAKWWAGAEIDDPDFVPATQVYSDKGVLWFDFAKPYSPQHRRLRNFKWSYARIAELTMSTERQVRRDCTEGNRRNAHTRRRTQPVRLPPSHSRGLEDLRPAPLLGDGAGEDRLAACS